VFRSSWSPTYDIRVFTDESVMKVTWKLFETGRQFVLFQVTYFGLIKQSTGEDWLETQVSLSTAMPSVGGIYSYCMCTVCELLFCAIGTIPELGTKKVSFVRR